MKPRLIYLTVILCVFFINGCKDDEILVPVNEITELHTNGTFVATSQSQVQGTMFITDQNGDPVNGLSSSNVSAQLRWGSSNPLDSGVGGVVIISQGDTSSIDVASAITMDYSGSMGTQQIICMENACTTYVNKMGNNDLTEVIKFSTNVQVVQSFTNNKNDLIISILGNWSGAGGSTALYQSIYKSLQDVFPQPSNLFVKAVIAFTDGEENASTVTRDQMISYALSNGIPIYTVGLLYNPGSNGARDLQNIADTSGAFYFYSHPDSCSNLNNIYSTISGQLEGAYKLTVNWQGNLPSSGTVVRATITTNYSGLSSSFTRSYVFP